MKGSNDTDDVPLARVLPFPIPETPLGTWSREEAEIWTCGETTYGADLTRPALPPAPDVPGERLAVEGADDSPFAPVLRFEMAFDGLLNCGGDCVYGVDLGRLAPVVPIAGYAKRTGPGERR